MKVVNILEIADVNEALLNARVPARVRLRDACGGQSRWVEVCLEAVAAKDDDAVLAAAREVVSSYFAGRSKPVAFDEDGKSFRLA